MIKKTTDTQNTVKNIIRRKITQKLLLYIISGVIPEMKQEISKKIIG